MRVSEWYFGFHDPARWTDVLTGKQSHTSLFGHVEAWGYTVDETWLFFDPRSRSTRIEITHFYEEVLDFTEERYLRCREILRIGARDDTISFPLFRPHLHCVTQCAALIGWRAYTQGGFRSMLLKNGAEIVHGKAKG